MVKILRVQRQYCLWPHCILRPQFEVFNDNGESEGEFCTRHSRTMKRRLERDGEVDLYSTPLRSKGAM